MQLLAIATSSRCFRSEAETTVANPVSTQDLGKPAITNGEIR